MSLRTRKLIGAVALIAFLAVYALGAMLVAVVVTLAGVSQIPSPVALATHTMADVTPVTPTVYPYGATTTPWGGGMPTATPTLQTTIDGSFINPPTGGASGPRRLLNGAPPQACWRRLMQPNPRLSRRTTTSFRRSATEVASS